MKKIMPLLAAALLAACGGIIKRPAIDGVKKVAIVSLYMNREFYNVNSPKAEASSPNLMSMLKGVAKAVVQEGTDTEQAQRAEIIGQALDAYERQLGQIGRWTVVPASQWLSGRAYKNFMKAERTGSLAESVGGAFATEALSHWTLPAGMQYIPISSVAESGTHYYYGQAKDSKETYRQRLAALCQALNVDGVALVEVDAGYRFNKLAKVTFGSTTRAVPSVTAALVVVNKKGEVAVNTGFIKPTFSDRYEGDTVGMVRSDKPFLVHPQNKIVASYAKALGESAQGMREKLAKALSKLP